MSIARIPSRWKMELLLGTTLVGLFLMGAFVEAHGQGILVGKNVQVSVDKSQADHLEMVICADPGNPQHLLALSMYQDHYAWLRNIAVYTSTDAGRHWSLTLDRYQVADPSCGYGPGAAYISMMTFPIPNYYEDLAFFRSEDSGLHWSAPTPISNGRSLDREWITVDTTTGKYRGRIYVAASGLNWPGYVAQGKPTIDVFHSADGGRSFSRPSHALAGVQHAGSGVVLSDGTYITGYYSLREPDDVTQDMTTPTRSRLRVVISHDGGDTLSDPVVVSEGVSSMPGSRASTDFIPVMAADQSDGPFRDRAYIVWTDLSSGRAQTWFSFSTDKGKSWAQARALNDDRPFEKKAPTNGPDDINPTLAVNKQGVVGVTWYDRRDNPEKGYWPRFTASLDGGETWLPSVRVSESPFTESDTMDWFVLDNNPKPMVAERPLSLEIRLRYGGSKLYRTGDTSGMAADAAGVFHPVWIDDRTGVHQLWTAPVTVSGAVIVRKDVTAQMKLEMAGFTVDNEQHLIHARISLENVSQQSVRGPLIIEALDPPSLPPGYDWFAANSTNGMDGAGAIWDFSNALQNNSLRPGERSTPREVIFRYVAPPDHLPIVTMSFRILGAAP